MVSAAPVRRRAQVRAPGSVAGSAANAGNFYKVKRVYIDVDADGLCDHARDRVFTDYRGHLGSGELVVREPRSNASDEFSAGSDQSDCVLLDTPLPEQ